MGGEVRCESSRNKKQETRPNLRFDTVNQLLD